MRVDDQAPRGALMATTMIGSGDLKTATRAAPKDRTIRYDSVRSQSAFRTVQDGVSSQDLDRDPDAGAELPAKAQGLPPSPVITPPGQYSSFSDVRWLDRPAERNPISNPSQNGPLG